METVADPDGLLDRALAEKDRRGEVAEPPATEAALARLSGRAREEFGVSLPACLLRRTDGVSFNGLLLYATIRRRQGPPEDWTLEGVVEGNLDWRDLAPDDYDGLLVLGEENGVNLVQDLKTGQFQVLDPIGFTVFEEFATFEELVHHALTEVSG